MRKTINYCDIYGTEDGLPFWVENGRSFNGVETETDWFYVDLGHKAASEVLEYIRRGLLTEDQKRILISHLKGRRKNFK